ncbi:MAG: oligosaccharide flippase family protein [Clostridia bacterium]|nr:oligosaccharide flippase family protein [Clostridia bacterium]
MKRTKVFILNALFLAGATLFMRTVSVIWSAYISNRIGAEGMGLFSLIMSAYAFAVTLATSGINLAVTRLVSEELAYGNGKGAVRAMRRCLAYAMIFGTTAALLLFFGAGVISSEILCDGRTKISLAALSVSLPFIAVSNVFSGYFAAVRRIYKSAVSNVIEQFIKIALILVALDILAPRGIEYACLALVIGTSVSEGISFSYMLVLYLVDKRRHLPKSDSRVSGGLTKRMLGISMPIAFSAYLRSGLMTAEHVLIPIGLKKNGANAVTALSLYGVVHGMVFPLILFPAALCSTFAALIVPELSELKAKYVKTKDNAHIKYIVSRSVKFGLLFAVFVAGALIYFSDELGTLVYGNADCGKYIRVFGFLVPVMYLDTVVDGMLKGLGEQLASMRYNIIDAAVSVLLVLLLVPRLGIDGYVVCVFAAETLNASLSLARLIKVTGFRVKIFEFAAVPALCAAGAVCAAGIATAFLPLSAPVRLALGIFVSAALYFLLAHIFGAITKDDMKWLAKAVK